MTTNYHSTAGYSMIDHQLDPLLEVAWTWLTYPDTTDERRAQDAEAIAQTLESAAAYVRAAAQRCEPLDIDCPECGAPPAQTCWTTEAEARAHVATMTDADLIDLWGGADELRSYFTVPTLIEMRTDTEQDTTYEDREQPHPSRVETAATIWKHEIL